MRPSRDRRGATGRPQACVVELRQCEWHRDTREINVAARLRGIYSILIPWRLIRYMGNDPRWVWGASRLGKRLYRKVTRSSEDFRGAGHPVCEGAEEEPEAAAAHVGRGQRWLPNGEKTRPKFPFGLSDESIKPFFGLDLLVQGFSCELQKSSHR